MYHRPQGFILSCQSSRLPSFIFSMPPLKWFESAVLSCSDTNLTWGSAGCFFAHNFLRIRPSIYTPLFIEVFNSIHPSLQLYLHPSLQLFVHHSLQLYIHPPLQVLSIPHYLPCSKKPPGFCLPKTTTTQQQLGQEDIYIQLLGSNPQLKTTSIL